MDKIILGLSRCLTGDNVRYDGQHKYDPFLMETLGKYVEYVPVCPEVECGLTVPRESMRLVGTVEAPRLITRNTKIDHTERMLKWCSNILAELEKKDLCGFIFKSKSPSSGMERVKVYNEAGNPVGSGAGIFAREFMKRFPMLPVEDEGRLNDPELRENFIERIFALKRFRDARAKGLKPGILVEFHSRHKLLILSHSEKHYRKMGRLVAGIKAMKPAEAWLEYEQDLMASLALLATPAKHVNVLQHMMGYFKDQLTSAEKQELLGLIEQFRAGDVPLVVPVTMIKHYVGKYAVAYLQDQYYITPHPLELRLRNHA